MMIVEQIMMPIACPIGCVENMLQITVINIIVEKVMEIALMMTTVKAIWYVETIISIHTIQALQELWLEQMPVLVHVSDSSLTCTPPKSKLVQKNTQLVDYTVTEVVTNTLNFPAQKCMLAA